MLGVFQSRANRQKMRKIFTGKAVQLELFKPNFTDDESEDNDISEEESQDINEVSEETEEEE